VIISFGGYMLVFYILNMRNFLLKHQQNNY